MTKSRKVRRKASYYRALIGSALVGTSLSQMALPVLAAGTRAGTNISNTATATYENPEDPNDPFTVESNRVIIEVAKVAGISAVPAGIIDRNDGSVQNGDILDFLFDVTNTGNDATNIIVPAPDQLIAQRLINREISLQDSDGTPLVEGTDFTVNNGEITILNVQPDQTIRVIVTGTANITNLGQEISVTLGNTGANDNSPGTQNQPIQGTGNLQTQAIGDPPANGEREASAFQSVESGTEIIARPLALALLLKTGTVTSTGAETTNTDNIITYNLELRVQGQSPNQTRFVPEDLVGTPIRLDGQERTRILVSDAIPAGTQLNAAPTAPAGWEVVYTESPLANSPVIVPNSPVPEVEWTTNPPNLSSVTRVGFIKTVAGDPVDNENTTNRVTVNTTVDGFSFAVRTTGLGVNGGTVNNIAQVFGRTYNDPGNNVEPIDQIVYDESGDQRPNNFNDNNTPPDDDGNGSFYDPLTNDGIADPNRDGVDPGNNNGQGEFGEVNKITIVAVLAPPADLLIGPQGRPDATGPINDNDDFTNKAASGNVDGNVVNNLNDVEFINTITNTTNTAFDNVTVEPITPSQASQVPDTGGNFGNDDDIPLGTLVTITVNGNSVTYEYVDDQGTKRWLRIDDGELPTAIDNFAPNQLQNYTVTITLPSGVDFLSDNAIPIAVFVDPDTSRDLNANPIDINGRDYFIPAYALVNGNSPTGTNVTINRVYAGGFMELIKEARILDANGTQIAPFSSNATIATNPTPGQFIEYRIRYRNVSTPATGSGNVTLSANNFRIVEDGNVLNGNNWAENNNTIHWQNTSATNGNVFFYSDTNLTDLGDPFATITPSTVLNTLPGFISTSDPTNGATVGVYINQIGTVAPQGIGNFTFRRQVRLLGETGPTNPPTP